MTKNQKIALGCGGAGCLGLIVVVIAGGLIYLFTRPARSNRNYNFNISTNRNSNSNDNSDFSSNRNTNDNSSNSNSSSTSDSTMSKDEKHKLYYAALLTGDTELIRRVEVKIDVLEDDFTKGAKFQAFVEEHATWTINNMDFIQSVDTAEKARAYINDHISD